MTRLAEQRTIIENHRAEIARLRTEEVGNLESEVSRCDQQLAGMRQTVGELNAAVGVLKDAVYVAFAELCSRTLRRHRQVLWFVHRMVGYAI